MDSQKKQLFSSGLNNKLEAINISSTCRSRGFQLNWEKKKFVNKDTE